MEWYLKVIRNYAGFEGRARRKEYWMFFLFNILLSIAINFIPKPIGVYIGIVYGIALFVPGLAVSVRRLHDVNKSGWHLLWGLFPVVGLFYLIYWLATDGTQGENQYGPDPKANER